MFKKTAQLLIKYIGSVKPSDLPPEWQKAVTTVLERLEKENPRITSAEIKEGPHKSHDDATDPMDVITVRLKDDNGARVDSIHIHEDGTSKQKRRG